MDNITVAIITSVVAVIGALIGFIGSIISGKVGGKQSYKGAMDATTKQIQSQVDLLKAEEDKRKESTKRIIINLLWNEIDFNCNAWDKKEKMFSKVYFLRDTPPRNTNYSSLNKFITFDNYNGIKFKLLEYDSEIILDIIEIYHKMYILKVHDDFDSMTQEDFDTVKSLYTLKDKIKRKLDLENSK